MNILTELKRRNVFRVALFYIVAAWVVIQVAETILPMFDVADGALRAVVIMLALGFPLALVFSWVFELTPDGIQREADVDAATGIADGVKQRTANKLNWATLVAAVLAIGLLIADRMLLRPTCWGTIWWRTPHGPGNWSSRRWRSLPTWRPRSWFAATSRWSGTIR